MSLKLQAIEEVIQRSEKIKRKREALKKKKKDKEQVVSPVVVDRSGTNSVVKKKMAMDTEISRAKGSKFLSRQSSIKKRSIHRKQKPSVSFSKDDDDDMNLHKFLKVKSKESTKDEKALSINIPTSMSTNMDPNSYRKSISDSKPVVPLLKLKSYI